MCSVRFVLCLATQPSKVALVDPSVGICVWLPAQGAHGRSREPGDCRRRTGAIRHGRVYFRQRTGVATGRIENGDYRAVDVPTGLVKITVQAVRLGTPVGNPKFGPLPASPPPAGKFVAVANRYGSPKTSPLQMDVAAGPQTKNFDLDAK